MTRWDLRHPWLVKTAWGAVAVLLVVILCAAAAQSSRSTYSGVQWKQPPPTTYYGPLDCWATDGPTLQCQRPYVPTDHGRR